jgi:hypothetical protein
MPDWLPAAAIAAEHTRRMRKLARLPDIRGPLQLDSSAAWRA